MVRRILALLCMLAAGAAAYFYVAKARPAQFLVTDAVAVPAGDEDGTLHVYFRLENLLGPAVLLSAGSDLFGDVDIVRPEAVTTTPIPARSAATFSSDGVYLRLAAAAAPVDAGTLVPLDLQFQAAPPVTFKARVGDNAMMDMDHSGHNMHAAYDQEPPAFTMDVMQQEDGTWIVSLETQNFEFAKPPDEGAADEPGKGHAHLYLNGLKLGRMYAPSAVIGVLPKGQHRVTVALNSHNHLPYFADGQPVQHQILLEALEP